MSMHPVHPRPPQVADESSRIKFSAVGDITLGDHPLCVGFGAYSKYKSLRPEFPFEHVLPELSSADVVFGNLECALSEHGLRPNDWGSLQMRGHPKHVEGLVKAGFRVLNLANNHSMHHGREPFLDTLRHLDDGGIATCGVSLDNHLVATPRLLHVADITICFLGYSLRPRQHFDYAPLYTEGQSDAIEAEVRVARTRADVVVVSLHWGEEFLTRPSPAEIRMARSIIDVGAHLIIGHHPHVLRGIETYQHGVIVYSLGNFIGDMIWDRRLRESMIFSCSITKLGVEQPRVTPVAINDQYQPEVLTGDKGTELSSTIQDLSSALTDEPVSFDTTSDDYQNEASAVLRRHRKHSRRHFLANLHRYPANVLAQQVASRLRRRFAPGGFSA